jgi:hypothetical protein
MIVLATAFVLLVTGQASYADDFGSDAAKTTENPNQRVPTNIAEACQILLREIQGDEVAAAEYLRRSEVLIGKTDVVFRALMAGVTHTDEAVRAEAIRALGPYGDAPEARAAACSMVRRGTEREVVWAASIIAEWKQPDCGPCILEGLNRQKAEKPVIQLTRAAVALRLTDAIPLLEARARDLEQAQLDRGVVKVYQATIRSIRDGIFLLQQALPK